MKLNYMTIMVRDLEKSLAFYQELAGLKLVRRFNPGPGEIAFLANGAGETMLELIQFDHAEKVEVKGMVLSFLAAEDLAVLREKALQLGYAPTEIISAGPKPDHFKVIDPDGIVTEFGL